jgi:hypothetical protein
MQIRLTIAVLALAGAAACSQDVTPQSGAKTAPASGATAQPTPAAQPAAEPAKPAEAAAPAAPAAAPAGEAEKKDEGKKAE